MNNENHIKICTQCRKPQDINQNICLDCPPTTYIVKGSLRQEEQKAFNFCFLSMMFFFLLVVTQTTDYLLNNNLLNFYILGAIIFSLVGGYIYKLKYISKHKNKIRFIRSEFVV